MPIVNFNLMYFIFAEELWQTILACQITHARVVLKLTAPPPSPSLDTLPKFKTVGLVSDCLCLAV